jgi:hypothetical protein
MNTVKRVCVIKKNCPMQDTTLYVFSSYSRPPSQNSTHLAFQGVNTFKFNQIYLKVTNIYNTNTYH